MTRRVLVTGGAGFIGSHLADELLARGLEVVVLDDLSTGRREHVPREAELVEGSVTDEAAVERALARDVDAVCHIAGQASIRTSFASPVHDLRVNVEGTVRVLEAALRHRVPRLLYASSMVVYGEPQTVPTPEDAPIWPVSYYGVTKAAGERYVHVTGARTDLAAPLAVTSFRMFNVYGPRQSLTNPYQGVLAIFLGNVLRGEPITIHGDGGQARDFVYVGDVVRAWADAIDEPSTHGRVLNLGSGRLTSVNRLCDTVLGLAGRSRTGWEMRSESVQQGDTRRSEADVTLAGRLLGWCPAVPLEEGLARTWAWARADKRAPVR